MFLIASLITIVGSIMMRLVRPTGWLKKANYKKLIWLMRAGIIFALVLFFLTENILAFIVLAMGIFVQSFIAIRHRPQTDGNLLRNWSEDLWILSLGLFGLLTTMPTIICAVIILVRTRAKFDARAAVKSLL